MGNLFLFSLNKAYKLRHLLSSGKHQQRENCPCWSSEERSPAIPHSARYTEDKQDIAPALSARSIRQNLEMEIFTWRLLMFKCPQQWVIFERLWKQTKFIGGLSTICRSSGLWPLAQKENKFSARKRMTSIHKKAHFLVKSSGSLMYGSGCVRKRTSTSCHRQGRWGAWNKRWGRRTRCTAIGDCGQPSVRAAVRWPGCSVMMSEGLFLNLLVPEWEVPLKAKEIEYLFLFIYT